MRHVTIIATALLFGLTACRKTNDQDAVRVATNKAASEQQLQELLQTKNNRDFITDTRMSQDLKQQYPMEYACTMDLCAPDFKKYPSIPKLVEAATKPTVDQRKYYDTYIVPALAKNSQLLQEKARIGLEVLNAKESAFPTLELYSQKLFILHAMYWMKNIDKNAELKQYWNSVLPQQKFFKAYTSYNQMGNWTYFAEMHWHLKLQDAVKEELKDVQATLKILNDIIQGAEKIDPLTVSKINAGQMITTEEAKALTQTAFSVRLMHHFLFGGGRDIITKQMEKHTFSKDELFKIYQESGIKTTLALQAKSTTPNNCEARYFQSINLYPQPQELEKFKKLAELTRQEALEQMGSHQPGYISIQDLKFNFPLTAQENSTAWLRALEMKNQTLQDEINELDKLEDTSLYAMFLIRAMFNTPDSAKSDQCPMIPDADISDKTNTDSGHVLISWYSVKYPEMGASILAHEIGHNAYAHSYPQSIESTKQCLERKQGSRQYLSEDFADVFAAKVMLALKNKHQIQTGNYGCGLMDLLQPLHNPNGASIHSSDLYRALQLKVETGEKIPASCEQLVQRDNRAITHSCQ
ncbi:hypothetical protein [Bdellovibrio sp. HCB288]|uniref:hypothetical protein n=1 Tax=Bdellovibrio sp. HCB288 TaxID=3394355 RepID=UPI0039B38A0F